MFSSVKLPAGQMIGALSILLELVATGVWAAGSFSMGRTKS